ncbi:MAG: STAS domain-containing protein [Planctomycetota bacterium]|jgi:anti-anti-sigma regulatory factor
MGLVRSGPDGLVFEGSVLSGDIDAVERALDVLRSSDVPTPVIDFGDVDYIPSRVIGDLVALFVDMKEQGRWFDLKASDKVWNTLDKAGVAGVFLKRPGA